MCSPVPLPSVALVVDPPPPPHTHQVWRNCIGTVPAEKVLPLLYLADDVMVHEKGKGPFFGYFGDVSD